MFLHELGASDPRFHTLTFHDGMNLLNEEIGRASCRERV